MLHAYTFLLQLMCVAGNQRLYDHQFPAGSENMVLPPTVMFSIYMGKVKYMHLPLLLESMRWNANVQFVLINIIEEGSKDADDIGKGFDLNLGNYTL